MRRQSRLIIIVTRMQTCRDILAGRYDDLPADAFYFSGDMAEIRGNLRRTLKFGPVTWPAQAQAR
jgi:F0F1-type ATP synthase beta subunit